MKIEQTLQTCTQTKIDRLEAVTAARVTCPREEADYNVAVSIYKYIRGCVNVFENMGPCEVP